VNNEELARCCAELSAAVASLQKRLLQLEAQRSRAAGGRFPKVMVAILLPLTLLLAAGGLLYADGAGEALFISPQGWVGIGTNVPKATLDVAGTLNVTDASALANTTISGSLTTTGNVGVGTPTPGARLDVAGSTRLGGAVGINRDPIADQHLVITPAEGNVPFNVTDPRNSVNWLAVLPGGNVIMNGGKVGIGTANPTAKLEVVGESRIHGPLTFQGRYQRDDQSETGYEVSPRYHVSLTGAAYAGRTKTIPQEVLVALCGDADGCEIRLGMTRWDNNIETETASRSGMFYYSAVDGRWRASFGETDVTGVDGNSVTEHVKNIWNTCFFTDGSYAGYRDLGDKDKGMQLLLWNGYKNQNRTCELTLID
jgi:hypothetical protein